MTIWVSIRWPGARAGGPLTFWLRARCGCVERGAFARGTFLHPTYTRDGTSPASALAAHTPESRPPIPRYHHRYRAASRAASGAARPAGGLGGRPAAREPPPVPPSRACSTRHRRASPPSRGGPPLARVTNACSRADIVLAETRRYNDGKFGVGNMSL